MKQWPCNTIAESNKLVFKSQLPNQLNCASVKDTGMLGHSINKGMDGAERHTQTGSQFQNGTWGQAYKQEQMLTI